MVHGFPLSPHPSSSWGLALSPTKPLEGLDWNLLLGLYGFREYAYMHSDVKVSALKSPPSLRARKCMSDLSRDASTTKQNKYSPFGTYVTLSCDYFETFARYYHGKEGSPVQARLISRSVHAHRLAEKAPAIISTPDTPAKDTYYYSSGQK